MQARVIPQPERVRIRLSQTALRVTTVMLALKLTPVSPERALVRIQSHALRAINVTTPAPAIQRPVYVQIRQSRTALFAATTIPAARRIDAAQDCASGAHFLPASGVRRLPPPIGRGFSDRSTVVLVGNSIVTVGGTPRPPATKLAPSLWDFPMERWSCGSWISQCQAEAFPLSGPEVTAAG